MVEQVLGVAGELAVRMQGEASLERLAGGGVERTRFERVLTGPATQVVAGELVAPAARVPESSVVGRGFDGPVEEGEAFAKRAASRHKRKGEKLHRLHEIRVDGERLAGVLDRARDVAQRLGRTRPGEQLLRSGLAQDAAPTRRSVSSSVNARNELVRTFPCALTASDTRVIVSSSGASPMMT